MAICCELTLELYFCSFASLQQMSAPIISTSLHAAVQAATLDCPLPVVCSSKIVSLLTCHYPPPPPLSPSPPPPRVYHSPRSCDAKKLSYQFNRRFPFPCRSHCTPTSRLAFQSTVFLSRKAVAMHACVLARRAAHAPRCGGKSHNAIHCVLLLTLVLRETPKYKDHS